MESQDKKIRATMISCGFIFTALFPFIKLIDNGQAVWPLVLIKEFSRRPQFKMTYIFLAAVLLLSLCYLVRSLLLLKHKGIGLLEYLPGVAFVITCILCGLAIQYYVFIYLVVVVVDFLIVRYLEDAQTRKPPAEEKPPRAVVRLKGKYPREIGTIIKKNYFRQQTKHVVFIVFSLAAVSYIFIFIAMFRLINRSYGRTLDITSQGLGQLFFQMLIIMSGLTLIIMRGIVSDYIMSQKQQYRLMTILGMRRSTVHFMFFSALAIDAAAALLAGLLGGYAVTAGLRALLRGRGSINLPRPDSFDFLITAGLFLLLLLVALGMNQEKIHSLASLQEFKADQEKEHCPQKKLPLLLVLGGLLSAVSLGWFARREWAESMAIHVLTIPALFLLLLGGLALWLKRRRQRPQKYFDTFFKTTPLYRQFWTNMLSMFTLMVIHFLVIAVFLVPLLGSYANQNIRQMYPYDIVALCYDEDMPALQGITEKYAAEVQSYPMLRMTSLYGSEQQVPWGTSRPVQWPQGQHVAVAETTYIQLQKAAGLKVRKLHLKPNEFHVVYQQDLAKKAHTIDWDTSRIRKHLRIGQPLLQYNTADYENVFPVRNIVSEERNILTGSFQQGLQENIIVMNDAQFAREHAAMVRYNAAHWPQRERSTLADWRSYAAAQAKNLTEGPTSLVCIRTTAEQYPPLLRDLQNLDKQAAFDQTWDTSIANIYGRRQALANMNADLLFARIAYTGVLGLLIMIGLIQYYLKFKGESEQIAAETRFLDVLGMPGRELRQRIRYRLRLQAGIPLVGGILTGLLYVFLTLRARLFTVHESLAFGLGAIGFCLLYSLLWLAWARVQEALLNKRRENSDDSGSE